MSWILVNIFVLSCTALLSRLLTGRCCEWAVRWGFLDRPLSEAHKSHRKATPVLGGLAMCAAWMIVIAAGILAVPLADRFAGEEISRYLPGVAASVPRLALIAAGGICMTALGMRDDHHAMKAWQKFLGQFVIAGVVSYWLKISLFMDVAVLNWFITVLWIMCVVNALNFFDNMDGLAGGTALVASFFFLFIALLRGQHFVALLSAATCGASLGFLMLNRPPAKIFMGDGGSHFLGFCLAVSGVLTTFYQSGESLTPAPVLIPVLVLSLPLFDGIAVVAIRIREHRPIYVGDNCHISHRFTRLGLTRPQAVFIICLLSVIQGAGAMTLIWLPAVGSLLVFLQAVAVFLVILIIQFYVPEANHVNNSTRP